MNKYQANQVRSSLLVATLFISCLAAVGRATADEPSGLDGSRIALTKTEAHAQTSLKPVTPETVQPLTVHPGLAKASTRSHRIIELCFNVLTGESPTVESEPSISVKTQDEELTKLKLRTSKFFYLADEVDASRVDGSDLTADNLLNALVHERVVVVTHIGNSLPEHYLAALASRAIIIRVPHAPKVRVPAEHFGDKQTHSKLSMSAGKQLPVTTFPQLCSTTTRELGVVEVCGCRVRYVEHSGSASPGISLQQQAHRYLATETNAYHPDGKRLSRDTLLSEVYCQGVALVSFAPVQPAAEYLAVLAEDALVLELPFQPLFQLDSKQPLAKRFYLPPSGLPDSLFGRETKQSERGSGLPRLIPTSSQPAAQHGALHFLTQFFRTLFG